MEKSKDLPYPKSVFFIIGNEFCERFSYYGMRAILSLYLKTKLNFSEDTATVLYHTFSCLCYFTPVFGAFIADQYLGKFRTIFYISILYVFGHFLKTIAAIPTLGLPHVALSLLGLLFIALGTGGIKPCVSAFGGDQFRLPQQEKQLQKFFLIFYLAINLGSLLSTFITPIIRQDVACFGDDTCYSLAFGVPAVLMFIATVIFVSGKSLYIRRPPEGNILTKVIGSIFYALKTKITSKKTKDHWMDYADEKYDQKLIQDVKILLKILILYTPIPIFWALFDQQGSRWTFQATRMNGDIHFYTIKPDQMQILNPFLIITLIPLFDWIIYPTLAKANLLKKPLQRIAVGGLLTSAAFAVSGFLELKLKTTYAKIPGVAESHLHLMNGSPCPIMVDVESQNTAKIEAYKNIVMYKLDPGTINVAMKVVGDKCQFNGTEKFQINAMASKVSGILIRTSSEKEGKRILDIYEIQGEESPKKDDNGYNKIRAIFDGTKHQTLFVRDDSKEITINATIGIGNIVAESEYVNVGVGNYKFYNGERFVGEIDFKQGGVYDFYVTQTDDQMKIFKLTEENTLHMLWLIPQFFLITVGEIMFSVTGLEFSYSQAPVSMKSVIQAAWLMTTAFGNVIVIIVAEAKAFDDQANEFFMFCGLMILDIILFVYLAHRYTYVVQPTENGETKNEISMEEVDK